MYMLNEYSFGEIYIRHAIDDYPDDSHFTMHIHEQCEIYFFISGNVEYLVEGSKYFLAPDTLMIMRPSEVHKPRIISGERYERYALNFPVRFAENIDPQRRLIKAFTERTLGKNNMLDSSMIDTGLVRKLFSKMCENSDDYGKQLKIKTHLPLLLDMISHAYDRQIKIDHEPKSTSERIVNYVNEHLFENISIPGLASYFYLSQSQFRRVFKQATGASPWEYITKKRLNAAKEKIRNGSSAMMASESCGFGDYSAFYRAYTKYFGCAPTNK